jgi:hypothetical protein
MPRRAAAMVAALAVTGAVGACGGSDDGGGSDEEQARAAVEQLYAALADYDAERACAQLNEAAQQQLADGGLGTESDTCVESFQGFLDESKRAGGLDLTLKAEVKRVEIDGDSAVAHVSFGGAGRTGEIPLEKVDGEWKLEAVGADPTP